MENIFPGAPSPTGGQHLTVVPRYSVRCQTSVAFSPAERVRVPALRWALRGVFLDPPSAENEGIDGKWHGTIWHTRMAHPGSPTPWVRRRADASGGRLQLPKLRRPQGGCFYGACLALLLRQLPKPEGRLDPRSEVYPAGLLAGQAPERMLKPCERSLNDPGRDSAPVWGLPGLATKQWLELEIDVGTESAPIPTRAGRPVPHATPTSPDKYQCRVQESTETPCLD
ncbi:hypothetical protein B2J93_4251 [Marssonina coronariae]|uniref:Uncharacterized protein n=1 Tax=Diplocarpon coronariae TaxID=2795749 RepID=A0A218YYE4_9HELO|nr:hypothetical protein B2J93_4251 [Marssonina coronariae]